MRRLARCSLCFAAILYFIGATAGSALHPHVSAAAERTATSASLEQADASSSKGSEPGKRAPHDELSCFLCKALSNVGIPPTGSATVVVAAGSFIPAPDPAQAISALRSAIPQARAPPAA